MRPPSRAVNKLPGGRTQDAAYEVAGSCRSAGVQTLTVFLSWEVQTVLVGAIPGGNLCD